MPLPTTRRGLESRGYLYYGESRCRGCGAEMLWFMTPNVDDSGKRKKMPFTIQAGTEDREERVLICHFGNCPNAEMFRKPKPPSEQKPKQEELKPKPPAQQDLFAPKPLPDWRKERDDGISRADEHAAEEWKEKAWTVLLFFIHNHDTFMAYEVTMAIRELDIPTPTDRALGALIRRAVREGLIEQAGYNNNVIAHGCPSPIWKSLVRKK